MPMVVPEPFTVTLTEPAAITATEIHNRLHVTRAHPPSPSVQRAAPHHIRHRNLYAISGNSSVYVTDANG